MAWLEVNKFDDHDSVLLVLVNACATLWVGFRNALAGLGADSVARPSPPLVPTFG